MVHAAATWFMVGLIWMVQVVHYPLFHRVGHAGFADYETGHTRRIGGLLVIPAGVEVLTAALLPIFRPDGVLLSMTLVAGALLAGIWVTTALVHAPLHDRLSQRFDRAAVDRLVAANWWRTAAWTARGALVGAMILV